MHCPGSVIDRLGGEIVSNRPPACRGEARRRRIGDRSCEDKTVVMHEATFEEDLERILAKDTRYQRDAYFFVREALDHTQKAIVKEHHGQPRHVSGQELLAGIRDYALAQFGPMVITVFEEWGIRTCRDFGEIVFNMVESGLLAKTDRDSRTDFEGGYEFEEAFRKPFLPLTRLQPDTKPVV
jgi:uncharacterized repeat protein (TIGR04138 family)